MMRRASTSASPGVRDRDRVHELDLVLVERASDDHAAQVLAGVICGRALYDGRLDLAAALAVTEGGAC